MCCMLTSLFFLGPRIAILVWWLVDQVRFEMAFDSFWVAFVGWLLLPWTTIFYVLVAPGGVTGFDWVWIVIGVLIDVSMYTGGFGRRLATT